MLKKFDQIPSIKLKFKVFKPALHNSINILLYYNLHILAKCSFTLIVNKCFFSFFIKFFLLIQIKQFQS